jgi:hypothetical protein
MAKKTFQKTTRIPIKLGKKIMFGKHRFGNLLLFFCSSVKRPLLNAQQHFWVCCHSLTLLAQSSPPPSGEVGPSPGSRGRPGWCCVTLLGQPESSGAAWPCWSEAGFTLLKSSKQGSTASSLESHLQEPPAVDSLLVRSYMKGKMTLLWSRPFLCTGRGPPPPGEWPSRSVGRSVKEETLWLSEASQHVLV